ncbi:hypothetical protein L596_025122 [Steinernema carpocapsae]|uniref:Uncharacterized protein n=1 Tax=Steinernema carpocapsae TaxID=34508 RepID=A0A4U5M6Y0_STECR|nr:hypothetical protein L596_025122 [Steinernema carpocapsae]
MAKKVNHVLDKNERFVEENSNARRQAAFDRYQIGLLEKENAMLTQKLNCSTPEDIEALVQHRVNEAMKRKLNHVSAVIRKTVKALNSCMDQLSTIAEDVDQKAKELDRREESELKRISQLRSKPIKVELEKQLRKESVEVLPSLLESPLVRVEEEQDNLEGGDDLDSNPILGITDSLRGCISAVEDTLLPAATLGDQKTEDEDPDLDFLSTTITMRSRARTKQRKTEQLSSVRHTSIPPKEDAKQSKEPSLEAETDNTVSERSTRGGTPAEGGRRKRTAASNIRSFKEPSLITKMRRSK